MAVLPVKCTYTARRPSVSSVASSGPGAEDVQPSLSLHADPVQASTLNSEPQVQGKVFRVSFHCYHVTEGSALTLCRPPPSTHCRFKVWRRPSRFIPTMHWPPTPNSPQVHGKASSVSFHSYHAMEGSVLNSASHSFLPTSFWWDHQVVLTQLVEGMAVLGSDPVLEGMWFAW